jgi:tRNA threonylcarbamoyladenosine biosynthesis protein TsaB
MSLILNIETATTVCSVALAQDGVLLALEETSEKNSHSAVVTILIDKVMKDAGKALSDLDAVAVSMGPGSYTGLRIGTATAKGLCYSLEKPLIGVSTLQAIAVPLPPSPSPKGAGAVYCPMLDARRMEVYCALYNEKLEEVMAPAAMIITEDSFAEILKDRTIVFAGEGAAKCKSVLVHQPNAIFADDAPASAKNMIPLSEERFRNGLFEDVAYFEPFYLKDFVAGIPRVKGLR